MNPKETSDIRIYLVDDEKDNVELLEEMLILIGYKNNYLFTNGKEAVNHLNENKPKNQEPIILFSDAYMPIMEGKYVIRNFIKTYNNVLTALITGTHGTEYAEGAGALAYMMKPIQMSKIEQIANFFSALGKGKLSKKEIEAFPKLFDSNDSLIIKSNLETYIQNNLLTTKARRTTIKESITPICAPPKTQYSRP